MGKFGKNAIYIEALLADIRALDTDDWKAYLDAPRPEISDRKEARRAVADLSMSASVSSAVTKAAFDIVRESRLTSDMFPGKKARFLAIMSDIEFACAAVSHRDSLNPKHVYALLKPFAEIQVPAAMAALASDGSVAPPDRH